MGVRLIWLTFQARVSKKLDTRLGMHMAAYEDNLLIEELDIIARVLEIWNTTWVGKYPKALRRDEVLLRFEGNKLPIPGSDILLLADFYRLHTTGANKEIYVPKTRKVPGGSKNSHTLTLELLIELDAYTDRIEDTDTTTSLRKSTKRKADTDAMSAPVGKQPRNTSNPFPKSSFVRAPSSASANVNTTETISLVLADVHTDAATGSVEITWPAVKKTVVAKLEVDKMMSGQTKHVYRLFMDGTTYVAKRFFNIGGDGAPGRRVSPSQNYQNLYQEVCRAIQGQWFLDEFYKLVRQRDIEVDMSFRFVRPLLAKEVIDDLGSFSLASGVSQADIDSDSEPDKAGAYWLIEPRRAASVRRWSGTMSHPVVAGQKGATMSVLAHFIYGYSNSELVAADLQSTIAGTDTGTVADVIFDIMTHTPDGCVLIYHNFLTMLHDTDVNATRRNSGVGDHGQEGIDAFIEQHECNYLCKEMGLVTEGGGSDGD
ncbi:hypothetical protein EVJ58_g4613 [Rhodofomes roseus]|uniref:Alpha-type protein kinase domain-containing protein n=1 Tax=Rhodofomes roseus TaxID=34475 RepID=A0A4Y9YHE6_9APHY|nr:hypothetical protein EVJ58_g4613 [Rhodofomes roseus]